MQRIGVEALGNDAAELGRRHCLPFFTGDRHRCGVGRLCVSDDLGTVPVVE